MSDTHERYFCRLCEPDKLAGEALDFVREYLSTLDKKDCVTEDEYARRLACCSACPALSGASTCMHCGCLVMVRAKKSAQGCPDPGGSRW